MQEMCYSALDLAAIIDSMGLSCRGEADLLDQIWQQDRSFLLPAYRNNRKKLILDVCYWKNYFYDKLVLDAEFPAVQKDLLTFGSEIKADEYISDNYDIDLFFKSLRIRILFIGTQDYSRIKLRTLMKRYGYRRRSPRLMQHLKEVTCFYHLQPYTRGYAECDLDSVQINEMITFRVV